jgi:hypothetical protein
VPKLSFVKAPLPVNAPEIYILVAVFTPALNENVLVAMDVVLVIDKVPASTFILALLVKLMGPVKVLDPSIFLIAPSEFIPVPDILIGSAAKLIPPSTCNTLPKLIVVVPVVEDPNALGLVLIFKIPAAVVVEVPTEISPVYALLFPLKVNIVLAPPSFMNAPAPVIGPDTDKLPEVPPKFNAPVSFNDSVIFVNVKVPASTFILAFALTVILFDKVFDPLGFLIAPTALKPDPVIKNSSGIVNPVPIISKVVLLPIVVVDNPAPPELPNASAFVI